MLILLEIFGECFCKLIGARGALHAATNARKALDCLGYRVALYKSRNALGVAVATANVANLCNNAVLNSDFDGARTNALCCVGKTIHSFIILSG